MKLIIIEGPDNCGKDTLIQKIMENYPTMTIIHCSKPKLSKTYFDKEQDALFDSYLNAIVNGYYKNTHCILMNRGVHGEYVYGPMYRGRNSDKTLKMIEKWEDKLLEHKDIKVCYVQLMSSDPTLLLKNEDNKSLSNGNLENIADECNRFKDIFEYSQLPKRLVFVNEDNGTFRSRESIYKEVMNFINKILEE